MITRLLRPVSDPAAIDTAAGMLLNAKLVAFPTETVYGLGALALSGAAVAAIFAAKERPATDPLIVHLPGRRWLGRVVSQVSVEAERLIEAFWPGPLTLILPRSAAVPAAVTAGLPGVGVRVPSHPIAAALLRAVDAPVAAPSANRFGHVSPTTAAHVLADLDGRIDAVLDGGPATIGVESTVLDMCGPEPLLLRPGAISRQELADVLGHPVCDSRPSTARADLPQQAPGQLVHHYSPRAEVRLYGHADGSVLEQMRRDAERDAAAGQGEPPAWLLLDEDAAATEGVPGRRWLLGPAGDLTHAARRLYPSLREADEWGAQVVLAHLVPQPGLGEAINDRLTRAAGGRVIGKR